MSNPGTQDANEVILNSIADGVFTVDREWRITSFNRAAEKITGIPREEALGQRCCEVFRASICETDCALRRTMRNGKPVVNKAVFIIDADGERVPISVSTAVLTDTKGRTIGGVETFRDLSLVEELRKAAAGQHRLADMISKNKAMQRIFDILPTVAESGSTVLIEGESGTGKELVARAVHDLSPRHDGPMITVNCAALPDNLLESELFGYKAGAFTDARRDKPGRFALADNGTIFLDEIGDVSPALQARLLRVLQERIFEPLGSTKPERTDVRVIAATNRNLEDLVRSGRFRQDLYYRINVVRLKLPPLRERKEDIPLLADHFITRFNRLREKDIVGLSPGALAILMEHPFPGNVRELENAVEHAFVLCRGGMIEPQHLPDSFRPAAQKSPSGGITLKAMEALSIETALWENNWKKGETARQLGIHPSTLWRKIKKHGIHLPPRGGRSSES